MAVSYRSTPAPALPAVHHDARADDVLFASGVDESSAAEMEAAGWRRAPAAGCWTKTVPAETNEEP